jgi:hypothetical protein
MSWLFRPSILVLISVALAITAGVVLVWPSRDITRPVPPGDQEIVWLNPATSAVNWERFVAAVRRLKVDRPDLKLEVDPDADPFPSQTADVPELAVTAHGSKARLWFRWYKLTGDLGNEQWVQALARRRPPPLAIIGGGSSDRALELAQVLNDRRASFAAPPLFLITQATQHRGLMEVYSGRSFRFCFTNRQMARAVTDFIWSQDDLRPDSQPIYLTSWKDDPYSEDLYDEFRHLLDPEALADEHAPTVFAASTIGLMSAPQNQGPLLAAAALYPGRLDPYQGLYGKRLVAAQMAKSATRTWGWLAGRASLGGVPPALALEGPWCYESRPTPFLGLRFPYSVGSFSRPNQWEEQAANWLLAVLDQHPEQQRPLLVLPATPQPARRFLRALVRQAPVEAGRFVVATGDGIDFNTVYRDRNLLWAIQDLPVTLVFFSHDNPVDPIAFRPDRPSHDTTPPDSAGQTSTGTQDLLLYRNLVETLVEAAYQPKGLQASADGLAASLHEARLPDDRRRFTSKGNQVSGTGFYVVCLRPVRQGDRVLPEARLQVWFGQTDARGVLSWDPARAGMPELTVTYTTRDGGENP